MSPWLDAISQPPLAPLGNSARPSTSANNCLLSIAATSLPSMEPPGRASKAQIPRSSSPTYKVWERGSTTQPSVWVARCKVRRIRPAGVFLQIDGDLRDGAILEHGKGMQRAPFLHQADAIGFVGTARHRAQMLQALIAGIEAIDLQHGLGDIVAVAGHHDHATRAHVEQIDIVDPARRNKMADLAVQSIDIQAGLLVGRDDQAAFGLARIAPDRRIVSGIRRSRAHRHGFRRARSR